MQKCLQKQLRWVKVSAETEGWLEMSAETGEEEGGKTEGGAGRRARGYPPTSSAHRGPHRGSGARGRPSRDTGRSTHLEARFRRRGHRRRSPRIHPAPRRERGCARNAHRIRSTPRGRIRNASPVQRTRARMRETGGQFTIAPNLGSSGVETKPERPNRRRYQPRVRPAGDPVRTA